MNRPFLTTALLVAVLAALSACSGGSQSGNADANASASPGVSVAPDSAGGGGGRRGGNQMGKILQTLGLSDDQKAQIRAIMADARKKNAGLDRTDPASRTTMRANMKAAYAKIDTVLTPAQRTQFHAKMDAMRAKYQKNRPQTASTPS